MVDFDSEYFDDTPEKFQCIRLWQKGNDSPNGLVGILVAEILDVEEMCEDLAQWNRVDTTRNNWIGNLTALRKGWNRGNILRLGPQDEEAERQTVISIDEDSIENESDSKSMDDIFVGTQMNRKRRKRNGAVSLKKIGNGSLSLTPSQLLKALKVSLSLGFFCFISFRLTVT